MKSIIVTAEFSEFNSGQLNHEKQNSGRTLEKGFLQEGHHMNLCQFR
jgi:hypothetical protein